MVDVEKKDGKIVPTAVKGLNREVVDEPVYAALSKFIAKNKEFIAFTEFLDAELDVDGEKYCAGDFFFDEVECDDDTLFRFIDAYNKLIDDGLLNSRNKKFDHELIRPTTRNMLATGLLWRITDPSRTWDICHIELNGPGFSKMICDHYLKEKAVPVDYIQIGEDALFRFSEQNPLNIECDVFPEEVKGKFDLKFTPRFGTGSMYVTSRSKIAQTLTTMSTFGDEAEWPKYLG